MNPHPALPPKHPDPQWWRKLPQARVMHWSDCCSYCGHVRGLHRTNGCLARSAGQFDKTPCQCSNASRGQLFHATAAL